MLNSFKTILTNKKQLTSNVYLFTFKLIEPSEINFIPGQYLILQVNKKPRLYSIASSNQVKNQTEFIIEIIPGGLASQYFLRLNINDHVSFKGPAGQFIFRENGKQKIFLVTGTGIAPARSIIISNIKNQISKIHIKNQKYYLFWGAKTYRDIYLLDELKQWSNETMEQFSFKICLSREQNLDMIPEEDRKYFNLGHIDTCLEKILNTKYLILNTEFYLCGRKEIVDSLKNFLISKNIPLENIIFERF